MTPKRRLVNALNVIEGYREIQEFVAKKEEVKGSGLGIIVYVASPPGYHQLTKSLIYVQVHTLLALRFLLNLKR